MANNSIIASRAPRYRIACRRGRKPGWLLPILLAMVLGMLLNACTTTPTLEGTPAVTATPQATALEQAGDFAGAAREYLTLARNHEGRLQQEYQLRAVAALLAGNHLLRAESLLEKIEVAREERYLQAHSNLLLAELRLKQHQPLETLRLTETLDPATPGELRLQHHTLRAQAYDMAGNLLESMRERILLEPLLTDAAQIYQNQKTIWNAATQLTPLALEHLHTTPPPDILSGWIELAWTATSTRQTPEEFLPRIDAWRTQYPEHPAINTLLVELQQQYQQSLQRPGTIALLLPLSGNLANAGITIRDGFLAAHYQKSRGQDDSRILVYDTGATGARGDILYRQAVAAGADIVVGPLEKEAVTLLATSADTITTPILALNQIEREIISPANLYQYGLSPEDEARQVAERTAAEGLTRAIVMVPDNDWGRRILAAFSMRFAELGGEVLKQELYGAEHSDFARPITSLLNLMDSEQRYRQLKIALGEDIKFEPRRRQDADFIFMAAFPRQARLIVPQLRFHRATDLPVYTTSHAYSGIQDTSDNNDLDGIIFCDIPWTLPGIQEDSLHHKLTRLWPDAMERYSRLYALGIDAYHLIPHLQWMRNEPYSQYTGETGKLYMDANNHIHRSLNWAQIIAGKAKPILQPVIPAGLSPGGPALQTMP